MSTLVQDPAQVRPRLQGETRLAVRGASWELYQLWVDSLPPGSGIRMAFDGENLEIMTKGPQHEDFRALVGRLVI